MCNLSVNLPCSDEGPNYLKLVNRKRIAYAVLFFAQIKNVYLFYSCKPMRNQT